MTEGGQPRSGIERRRVVVTGLGVVSPVGSDVATVWRRLNDGESGLSRITRFDPSGLSTQIAGEVSEFDPSAFVSRKELRRLDDFAKYAIGAADMAVSDAKLDGAEVDGDRCGVVLGSSIGGLDTIQFGHYNYVTRGPNST